MLKQASAALTSVDTIVKDPDELPDYTAEGAVAALRTAATDEDETLAFWHQISADDTVPAEIVEAIAESLSEAVRNSVRHAGENVKRAVTVSMGAGEINATVQDDGRGFNPRAVNPRRLGLRVSIVDRMERLPGGSANIDTKPGSGTTVTLTWEQPS